MYWNKNYIPVQYSGATPAVPKKWVLELACEGVKEKEEEEEKFQYGGDPFTFTVRTLSSTFENPDFFREPQE